MSTGATAVIPARSSSTATNRRCRPADASAGGVTAGNRSARSGAARTKLAEQRPGERATPPAPSTIAESAAGAARGHCRIRVCRSRRTLGHRSRRRAARHSRRGRLPDPGRPGDEHEPRVAVGPAPRRGRWSRSRAGGLTNALLSRSSSRARGSSRRTWSRSLRFTMMASSSAQIDGPGSTPSSESSASRRRLSAGPAPPGEPSRPEVRA